MKLPLSYMDLEVGDKIYIPLIKNEKIFDMDYSKVTFLNGQAIYPLWIIMETNIGVDSISIKAYQLHYLGTDGNHGFQLPDETYQIYGNTDQYGFFMFTNETDILNWNYNPLATINNNYQIPYFDLNGDEQVNVLEIIMVVEHITGGFQLTSSQKERLKYRSNGTIKENNVIDILDLVSLVNIILFNGYEDIV